LAGNAHDGRCHDHELAAVGTTSSGNQVPFTGRCDILGLEPEHVMRNQITSLHLVGTWMTPKGWDRIRPEAFRIGNSDVNDFEQAGYPHVELSVHTASCNWMLIHEWLKNHCEAPYTWFGNTFFFQNEPDAIKFSLTWVGT
jgi:hypothetical protein